MPCYHPIPMWYSSFRPLSGKGLSNGSFLTLTYNPDNVFAPCRGKVFQIVFNTPYFAVNDPVGFRPLSGKGLSNNKENTIMNFLLSFRPLSGKGLSNVVVVFIVRHPSAVFAPCRGKVFQILSARSRLLSRSIYYFATGTAKSPLFH